MRPLRSAVRVLVGAAIATILSFALGSPAHAAQVELDQAHRQILAGDVAQRCAAGTGQLDPRMADRGPHQDGWFFEVGAGSITSLTVTFEPSHESGEQMVVTGTAGDPDSAIAFYSAGPFVPHAYVFTPAGWRLVTATAEIQRGSRLILRHACAGEPASTPSPSPTPSPAQPPTPTQTPGQPPAERPGLAATGARTGGLVVLGTGLLAAGVAMVAVRRRRRHSDLFDS